MTVGLGLIFLLLTPLVLNVPNLYISLALIVFTIVKTIEMMLGLSSLKNQELTLKNWTVELQDDPETGDLILPFPEDMLKETGWKEGDELIWTDNKNGSWSLAKKSV
jgi:hypothetical protein